MKNKGFTMLELLISISVMAILTSVSFWGYAAKNDTLALRGEINGLASRAENMRERALGSQFWHGILPKGGYGIFLKANTNQYISFADCDGGLGLNLDGDLNCNGFRERIETWSLGNRVEIKNIFAGNNPATELTILYRFPFPETIIKDGGGNIVNDARVVLQILDDPTKEKIIHFNSTGLIYVE
jgi:prepilin-type N-terminal cleavage/methylation domain-containing protein